MDNPEPTSSFPSAFSLFKPSWQAFTRNFETFVWQLLLPTALAGLMAMFWAFAIALDAAAAYILAVIITIVIAGICVIVTCSLFITELKSARHETIGFKQALVQTKPYIWRLIGLFLLSGLIIFVGFLLLIVPGVFALQRLLLSPYYLMDQNLSVMEAMRRSRTAGKQYSGPVWGVLGILIAINLVSLVPFVGWLAATVLSVVYLCAPAIRYVQVIKGRAASPTVEA